MKKENVENAFWIIYFLFKQVRPTKGIRELWLTWKPNFKDFQSYENAMLLRFLTCTSNVN